MSGNVTYIIIQEAQYYIIYFEASVMNNTCRLAKRKKKNYSYYFHITYVYVYIR